MWELFSLLALESPLFSRFEFPFFSSPGVSCVFACFLWDGWSLDLQHNLLHVRSMYRRRTEEPQAAALYYIALQLKAGGGTHSVRYAHPVRAS